MTRGGARAVRSRQGRTDIGGKGRNVMYGLLSEQVSTCFDTQNLRAYGLYVYELYSMLYMTLKKIIGDVLRTVCDEKSNILKYLNNS